ncbi:MFS transporter [Cohnella caldifontis]|uniref:MFS transporter n=1 Tax=Cohnella caldifontis TaxID=3027471 RepID=UPI0023EB796E|nr:MFS transporter [Cohnella sp. YIM B05605]
MEKAREERHSGRSGNGWAFLLLCFGVFMVYLDAMIVNVALPDIRTDWDVGIRGLQWVINAYSIPFACLLLAGGVFGDSFGYKKMFLLGMAGFTLSSIWCAESASIGSLLSARAVQGAFGALLIPVSLAIIRAVYHDPVQRAKAIGIWAGIGGVALAAGPLVGGWLVERYGWESVFWLNVPIGAVVFAALSALMKEPAGRKKRSLDFAGQILFIAGIASLSYGLIESHSLGWDHARIVGSLAFALAAIAAFVWREHRHREPLLPMDFFRQPLFVVALLVNLLAFFSVYAVTFLMTLYLQNVNGLSAIDTGLRFLPLTLGIMVMSALGSRLAVKFSPLALIPAGSFAVGAALLWLTALKPGSGLADYVWPLLLLGIGLPIAGTSATVTLMSHTAPERAGMASGIANTFRQISAVVAVALSGSLMSAIVNHSSGSRMDALQVPGSIQPEIREALASGNLSGLASSGLPARTLEALGDMAPVWFVQGMGGAFVLAGAAGLACGVLCLLILIRSRISRPAVSPAGKASVPTLANPE